MVPCKPKSSAEILAAAIRAHAPYDQISVFSQDSGLNPLLGSNGTITPEDTLFPLSQLDGPLNPVSSLCFKPVLTPATYSSATMLEEEELRLEPEAIDSGEDKPMLGYSYYFAIPNIFIFAVSHLLSC